MRHRRLATLVLAVALLSSAPSSPQVVQDLETHATERLRAARELLKLGLYADSVTRAYYAAFSENGNRETLRSAESLPAGTSRSLGSFATGAPGRRFY
jgi:hypothetical protein